MLLLGGVLIASTGCASTTNYDSQINGLQSQLAQTQAALQAEQAKSQALEDALSGANQVPKESYKGATYRTPTGFEIPAVDVQKALKGAGYYSGEMDGKIGPDAREAIRNFQRDNGLTPDGVCGKQTWTKLKTHLA